MTIGGLRHSFESSLEATGVDTDDRGERNRPVDTAVYAA
jgi:hypothetical protein